MEKPNDSQFRQLDKCSWFPFNDEPVLTSTPYASCFSDPQVLSPALSCDGKWHMFFHSWIGIHHFVSDSGIEWAPRKMIELRGHSPFIFKEKENFYLIYEKHDRDVSISRSVSSRKGKGSRVEIRSSTDLVTWSKPRTILEAKDVSFAGDYLSAPRISRPQLVKKDGIYTLFFGASEVIAPDTGRKFTRYFSYAQSDDLKGPYKVNDRGIIMEPYADDSYSNLACGSIKVILVDDTFFAFQCAMYWDYNLKKTSGCLILLKSSDAVNWERCTDKPILVPSEKGWTDTYIKACDITYIGSERSWYCYYSALGHDSKNKTREEIGLLLGTVPVKSESKDDRLRTVLTSFFG